MTTHPIHSIASTILLLALGCDVAESAASIDADGEDSSSSGSPDLAADDDPDASTGEVDPEPADDTAPSGGESSPGSGSATGADEPPPAEAWCGDGERDDGEECDEGTANALFAACMPDCTRARCGDGELQVDVEVCDDGDAGNALAVGACAPDCSRIIESKTIRLSEAIERGGDFGQNPVAFADSSCEPGYRAMFTFPGVREATFVPLHDAGSIDWVLQPFTAYANGDGEVLWVTGRVPQLGVRDGAQHPLLAAVTPASTGTSTVMSDRPVVTGLAEGWLTSMHATAEDSCAGWSMNTAGYKARAGRSDRHDAFLDRAELAPCDAPLWVYCVEQ